MPGMSTRKAAVVNISSVLGSMQAVKESYSYFSAVSYRISKVRDNSLTLWHATQKASPNVHPLFELLHSLLLFTQAALNMLTLCGAEELKKDEILFALLHPGWVRTDMGGEEVSQQFSTDL